MGSGVIGARTSSPKVAGSIPARRTRKCLEAAIIPLSPKCLENEDVRQMADVSCTYRVVSRTRCLVGQSLNRCSALHRIEPQADLVSGKPLAARRLRRQGRPA